MNRPRTCVEWGIGKVTQLWRYVDLARNHRVLAASVGVGKMFRVAAFLTNCHTCLEGSLTGHYFGLAAPSLSDYLRGFVNPQQGFGQ